MRSGEEDRTTGRPRQGLLTGAALCWLVLLAGCSTARKSRVDQALLTDAAGPAGRGANAEPYQVNCPDVIEVTIDGPTSWKGRLEIGGDGRIDLGALGKPRVEGLAAEQAAAVIARQAGVRPEQVHIGVAQYRSQKVYVFGQVNGLQRAVDYRGTETILDLLRRVGGITAGAAPTEVYVIRSNIADGGRPEVHTVNLRDIVMKKDMKTNLTLEPCDQITIGETRKSTFAKCVPPFLRPLYDKFVGLYRPGQQRGRQEPAAGPPAPPVSAPAALPQFTARAPG